jgi:hypothetical protein
LRVNYRILGLVLLVAAAVTAVTVLAADTESIFLTFGGPSNHHIWYLWPNPESSVQLSDININSLQFYCLNDDNAYVEVPAHTVVISKDMIKVNFNVKYLPDHCLGIKATGTYLGPDGIEVPFESLGDGWMWRKPP